MSSKKLIECPANDFVAFARRGFQPLAVDDLDSSALIPYEVPRLQRATTVTLERRSPSISANRCWLNEMLSPLPCSLRTNSKRLKREVASCTELHNEVCCTWHISAM